MAVAPDTKYAFDGEHHVAYQVLGEGGPDLLYVPTATFPIDLMWDEPVLARGLHRLASFSRLITCDLIGVGSSDAVPIAELPAMQAWTDGIGSALDAAGSECAAIFAARSPRFPRCCTPRASRRESARSCSGLRSLGTCARPTLRTACPSRRW